MNFNNETDLAPATPVEDRAISQETAGTAPFGAEEFGTDPGLDPLAGATAGRKLSGGTIIIIAVVLSAVAGLFSMRKLAEVTAAATVDADIEKTIDSFFKKIDPSTGTPPEQATASIDTVLGILTETYSERQVPLQDVQRDPFVIAGGEVVETPDDTRVLPPPVDGTKAKREYERKLQEEEQKMRAAGERIVVKSIMGGSRPMALIGGKICSVDDIVTVPNNDTEFKIESISSGSVDLVAESADYGLSIRITVFLQRDR